MENKNGDVENKVPNISGLASTAILNTNIGEVGNNISDVSGQVKKKKTDYDPEISDIEGKYIAT